MSKSKYGKPKNKKMSLAWKRRRPATLKKYLLLNITKDENGCWNWKKVKPGSYGQANYKNVEKPAHIASYKCFVKKVPAGKIVRHKCDNTRCINPKHLLVGTKKDNRRDFMERHPRAREIILEGVERATAGVRRFWKNISPSDRKKFIARRAKIQREKYPPGSEMFKRRGKSIKKAWDRRKGVVS